MITEVDLQMALSQLFLKLDSDASGGAEFFERTPQHPSGLFGYPKYGGNKGFVGWKMLQSQG